MAEPIYFLNIRLEYWTLMLAGTAILFTTLKDFILPFFIKPKLEFCYEKKSPYRRENVNIYLDQFDSKIDNPIGVCERFMIKNVGSTSALGCRCQICSVKRGGKTFGDYQGYPLRWASRPESIQAPIQAERLNIGKGEIEFVDFLMTHTATPNLSLQKYHAVPIGIPDEIPEGDYEITVLVSGNNFRPYLLVFDVSKKIGSSYKDIKIKMKEVKRK